MSHEEDTEMNEEDKVPTLMDFRILVEDTSNKQINT